MDLSDLVPQAVPYHRGQAAIDFGVIAPNMQELRAKKGPKTSIFLVSKQYLVFKFTYLFGTLFSLLIGVSQG